jgi:hypothetical protein
MNGSKNISLKDEKGNVANITTYDVNQSNGVIHVLGQSSIAELSCISDSIHSTATYCHSRYRLETILFGILFTINMPGSFRHVYFLHVPLKAYIHE